MDSEVIEVLKEIRDEARATNGRLDQTNARLDQTNSRLETVDGRLRFVEKRLKDGFDELSGRFGELSEKIDTVAARQLEAEARTTTEIIAVGKMIMKVVQNHETRISALERQR